MQLFIDSADMREIEWWTLAGVTTGVTTNPAIVARDAPGVDVKRHITAMAAFMREIGDDYPVSVQLSPCEDPSEWISLGSNVIVKCPMCAWGLEAAALCLGRANITAIMNEAQAMIASRLNPRIMSIFWGRILDTQRDPATVVRAAVRMTEDAATQILVGSIRAPGDVVRAQEAGADICTVSPRILRGMMQDPATDKIMAEWYPEAQA